MGPKCLNLLLLISSSKLILDAFGQAQFFYHLAVREHDNHNGSKHIEQLHLLRIPKASSSAVSVVARRVVGCDPPGPCCKYPGDPPGTCPSKKLYACMLNNKVIGCTNHNSNYEALSNTSIPSITILRAPIARSLSAFFYPGVHHNSHCNTNVHSCFGEYLHDHRWQNVVTKMLTGAYAYANVATCEFKSQCEHSLQLAFQNLPKLHFAGVAECWELSLLLLHRRFPQLTPELSEFELLAGEGQRINDNTDYAGNRSELASTYQHALQAQNKFDLQLYRAVVQGIWQELQQSGLWRLREVRDYWHSRMQDTR